MFAEVAARGDEGRAGFVVILVERRVCEVGEGWGVVVGGPGAAEGGFIGSDKRGGEMVCLGDEGPFCGDEGVGDGVAGSGG